MTDPIGTAQERELIEALRDGVLCAIYEADGEFACAGEDRYTKLAEKVEQAADALQSRIAEVGDLKHDLERQMTIANTYVNEVEELRQALADTHNERAQRIAEVGELRERLQRLLDEPDDLHVRQDAALSLQRRPT